MPLAVVTGANSGIGFALAQLLINEGYEVHAADLSIDLPLQSLPECRLHRLDVRTPESVQGFAAALAGKPVDVLLNVAGVMDLPENDALATVSKEVLTRTFETNTFGPLLLTQALLQNLLAAAAQGEQGARVGIVSSRVGSIGDNSTGGSYAYRASKAAVNSIGRSMAVDLQGKGVFVALLHPGIVNTNLSTGVTEPQAEAVEPEEAARKLWALFSSKGMEETGRFWHREGEELPW